MLPCLLKKQWFSALLSLYLSRPPPSIHKPRKHTMSRYALARRTMGGEEWSRTDPFLYLAAFTSALFSLSYLFLVCWKRKMDVFVAALHWGGTGREGKKKGCSLIMQKTKHSVSSYSLSLACACLLVWFSFVLRGGVFCVRVVMLVCCFVSRGRRRRRECLL